MHYIALATDYDGTLAHDGVVDEETGAALVKFRQGTRRLILVTGRELPDLHRVMPDLDVFDIVVAENGACLYLPATKEERVLGTPPDPAFVERLRALAVDPLSVGRVIVATWEPNEAKVLQAVRELGLELNIIFNKGAVMVLPPGVNKASGLRAALEALGLSPVNCVAIGDAENDMAFLHVAGASVAVANALPALKKEAAWVTQGERGRGVAELIGRVLDSDLADLDQEIGRQKVALAKDEHGGTVDIPLHRETLLLAGVSGGGKSTFTQGLTERLARKGFQFCILDPEGDYEQLPDAVTIGTADQPPEVEQVLDLLRRNEGGAVVNLLGVPLDDRPAFLAILLPGLTSLRSQLGRPHMIIVDEAHHMLPAQWDPGGATLPQELEGFLFITTRPSQVSPRLLGAVDRLLVVGQQPGEALETFCRERGLCDLNGPDALETGEVLMLETRTETLTRLRVIPGTGTRMRHRRKYSAGTLGEDKSFWFRGPQGKLQLRAQNLMMFLQMAEGVDEETWQWHRMRHDFSRWFETAIKDSELASEAASVEAGDTAPDVARRQLREAVERRYTLPG